jgi:hypothetical protein
MGETDPDHFDGQVFQAIHFTAWNDLNCTPGFGSSGGHQVLLGEPGQLEFQIGNWIGWVVWVCGVGHRMSLNFKLGRWSPLTAHPFFNPIQADFSSLDRSGGCNRQAWNAILDGMPKARKPAPVMYSKKGSTPNEPAQKPSTRTEQKADGKKTNRDSNGQTRAANQGPETGSREARASVSDKNAIRKPVSENQELTRDSDVMAGPHTYSVATLDDQPATETTSETSPDQVKEIPPVAFCANGFILANAQRLGEEFKLEISLESGLGFVGTPAFPFSKRLERGNTWPNGLSRVGLFPRTDSTGRLLATQQMNSVRNVLETDTVTSSFHLVGFPVDTRGLLTVRIFPQRTGMKAFNVTVQATTELLEVATVAGEARNGVEVFGEILEQNGGLELLARSVVGLRLVIPRHHLPGFKPGKAVQDARHDKKQTLPE